MDPSVSTAGHFDSASIQELAQQIALAGGNEVFFFGKTNAEGMLIEVELIARGNRSSVPVFLERAQDHDVLIHNHPSGNLLPSQADLFVASEAGSKGLGFFIIDNTAERVYRVVEPFAQAQVAMLELDELEHLFSSEGALSKGFAKFEERLGQKQLAKEVGRSFNDNEISAFEAGTGIGKSFAYLLPAILWAVENNSRVMISTATIALQEQLITKDLPALKRVLSVDFRYSLLKGRGNYACRRKTEDVALQTSLFVEDPEQLEWAADLIEKIPNMKEGSLSELSQSPPAEVWSHFNSSSDQSLKTKCPHYRNCFYYESRRRAARAHVIVVNHHLFFTDLAARAMTGIYDQDLVLPSYKRVIFDEAHRLEGIAAEHFGYQFSRIGLLRAIGRLQSKSKNRKKSKGRMNFVRSLLETSKSPNASDNLDQLNQKLVPSLERARSELEQHIYQLGELIAIQAQGGGAVADLLQNPRMPQAPSANAMYRVGDRPGDLAISALEDQLLEIRSELGRIISAFRKARDILRDQPIEPAKSHESVEAEYRSAQRMMEIQQNQLDGFLDQEKGKVAWIETTERPPNLILRVAPVHVAKTLAKSLYEPMDSVVMTSATLSVNGKWDYMSDRLGWQNEGLERFHGQEFQSPFDYEKQVLLLLPKDMPRPDQHAYLDRLQTLIQESSLASGGGCFVLFTSHQMLRNMASRCSRFFAEHHFPFFVHGEAPRTHLLQSFKKAGNGVLFGNQSFWEGVDVPGKALSCVIIAKLPFQVPSHPLEVGRSEDLQARGLNPFRHMTLPQATLALKQGFGRLIRSTQDRGVVIIADSRMNQASYGKFLLKSLPPARQVSGPWHELHSEMKSYFRES